MTAISIQIVRLVDDHFPGFVECRLIDIGNDRKLVVRHLIHGRPAAQFVRLHMRALAAIAIFLIALSPFHESVAAVPEPIVSLAKQFGGKSPDEVRELIVRQFGPHHRDTGSGLSIPQWDVFGGVLTFHPLGGPSFFDPGTKKVTGLVPTHNTVRENLLRSYEMSSRDDHRGQQHWLGSLEFPSPTTYRFTKSPLSANAKNFFTKYPTGTVVANLARGVADETLLESLEGDVPIAKLIFTSADGQKKAAFSIVSSEQSRSLKFVAPKNNDFEMNKGWENFWK